MLDEPGEALILLVDAEGVQPGPDQYADEERRRQPEHDEEDDVHTVRLPGLGSLRKFFGPSGADSDRVGRSA
jgi:hypothetical protein